MITSCVSFLQYLLNLCSSTKTNLTGDSNPGNHYSHNLQNYLIKNVDLFTEKNTNLC
ncbi:hypothetical protein ACFW04_005112 [Cataglyphis niger]